MLLFTSARELVTNVVKHANARRLDLRLSLRGDRAELVVADDGLGLADGVLATRLAEGHIGLESYRVRLEAATADWTRRAAAIARLLKADRVQA